ncbi:MAG: hypothetical protein J6K74_01320 [Marinifilaceae bacterium]|nr:hypothetical protein [Marinifilaceae bacterium]
MKKLFYTLAGVAFALTSCEEIEEGYMSENVYYLENPYYVEQGSTVNSAALELDMSTTPVIVKLLDIRNVETGMTEEAWYGQSAVCYWLAAPSIREDTTLELLQKKYTYKDYPIFRVNEVGGRLEFSAGTKTVPLGEYEIDIVAENMRETRYIYNACNIILTKQTQFVTGAIDGNASETGAGGDENASNAQFTKSGASCDPSWSAPFAHYEFMTSEDEIDLDRRLDSVISLYPEALPREMYMEKVVDAEGNETGEWTYRKDFSWVMIKFTDSERKSFYWVRNHNFKYDTIASYENVVNAAGEPVQVEIRPIFNGTKLDPADWQPYDAYTPWLTPIYCGEYLLCPYPVAPFPASNIKEPVNYCRYTIRDYTNTADCNITVLANFVVGRSGMYKAELQLQGEFTVKSTMEENEGEELYKGPIKRVN